MSTTLRGWQAASRAVGLPIRTLRRLHADGILHGTKSDDGVWQFTRDALEAAAAVARNANVPSAVPAAIAPPVPAAPTAIADDPPAPREAPVAAPWLLRAGAGAPEADSGPGRAYEPAPAHAPLGTDAEQPFWVAQGIAGPASRREVDALTALLEAARTENAQLRQQAQQQHAQAQQQIAQLQQQLRAARISALSQMPAIESLAAAEHARVIPGAVVDITHYLRDCAARALSQLTPEQLANDGVALQVARHTAQVANVQVAQQIERERRGRRGERDVMPPRRSKIEHGGN